MKQILIFATWWRHISGQSIKISFSTTNIARWRNIFFCFIAYNDMACYMACSITCKNAIFWISLSVWFSQKIWVDLKNDQRMLWRTVGGKLQNSRKISRFTEKFAEKFHKLKGFLDGSRLLYKIWPAKWFFWTASVIWYIKKKIKPRNVKNLRDWTKICLMGHFLLILVEDG